MENTFKPLDRVTTVEELHKRLTPFDYVRRASVIMTIGDGVMIIWDYDDIPRVLPANDLVYYEEDDE